MHEEPVGARFIVVSKKYCTKLILKAISKAFKLIFHQIRSFYDKSHFYSSFKQFWIIEDSKFILEKFEKVNYKANAKAISTIDFSMLYIKWPHFDLISLPNDSVKFAFFGGR